MSTHKRPITSLAVLQNGYLASGWWDKTIKIWNVLEDEDMQINKS